MRPSYQITITVILVGLLWVWGTDYGLSVYEETPFDMVAALKGSIFVLLIAVVIYFPLDRQQKQLVRSEASFRKLYYDNPEAVIIYRIKDFNIRAVNDSASRLYQSTDRDLIDSNFNGLRINSLNSLQSGTEIHRTRKGRRIVVELKLNELTFRGENCAMVVIHDVTEKEELKNALLRRESLLDSIVNTENAYLVRMNSEGHMEYANPAFLQAFRVETDEAKSAFSKSFLKSFEVELSKVMDECIKHPNSIVPFSLESNIDGEVLKSTWEFMASVSSAGSINGVIGVGRNHIELDEIRASGTRANSRLNLLMDSIKDGFFILDFEMKVVLANKTFSELIKVPSGEIIGKHISEVIPNWKNTKSSIEFPKAIVNNESTLYETYNPFYDQWLEINVIPFEGGLAVFYHDNTEMKESELKFKRNEANLQSLLNNTRDYIWSIDSQYKILTSNLALRQLGESSFNIEMNPGSPALPDTLKEPIYSLFQELYRRALRGEHVEEQLSTAELIGQEGYLELNISPIRDEQNEILGAACFARDVTEKEIHRLALQKAIEQQEIVSEVTKDAIWDYRVEDDFLTWSDGIRTTFGYEEVESSNIDWWAQRVHPDDYQGAVDTFMKAMENGSRSWRSRYRFRKADGEYIWTVDRGIFIRDKKGNAIRAVGSVQDISQIESYRFENETLSLAVSRASVGIALLDDSGAVEWVNEAYENLTGYPLNAIKGKKLDEVSVGKKSDTAVIERLAKVIDEKQDATIEILNYHARGHSYWVRMSISPIVKDGDIQRFMVMITDITDERKIASRLLSQNENLKKIAFILSHDLRKPVSSIIGLLELFDTDNISNPMNTDIVKYLHKATEELDDMVHDIIRHASLIDDD